MSRLMRLDDDYVLFGITHVPHVLVILSLGNSSYQLVYDLVRPGCRVEQDFKVKRSTHIVVYERSIITYMTVDSMTLGTCI